MARACSSSYSGGWGRGITWTWETEFAVSWDVLQPGNKASLHLKNQKDPGSVAPLLDVQSGSPMWITYEIIRCNLISNLVELQVKAQKW